MLSKISHALAIVFCLLIELQNSISMLIHIQCHASSATAGVILYSLKIIPIVRIATRGDLSKKYHRYVRKCLLVATWNVRTLVENAGDERIRRRRPQEALSNPQAVDRKLKRYHVWL